MSATAVDLHVLGASALAAVRTRALSALAEWSTGWLSQSSLLDALLACSEVTGDEPHPCFDRIDGPGGVIWIRTSTHDRAMFANVVLGAGFVDAHGDPADEWLDHAVCEARRTRDEALCTALVGGCERTEGQRLPSSLWRFGSGAIEIRCEAIGLLAVVDHGALRHVPPRESHGAMRLRPTPLDQMLPDAVLRLSVALGSVELEVGRLFDLREGDVLRLPTRLDKDLVVECEERPLARGRLGVRDGKRAIQIV